MADAWLYLTELLGLPVFDLKGRTIGRVKECALAPLVDPARVDRFLIGAGGTWLTVRYDQVRAISLDGIDLNDEQLTPYHSDEYMLRLVRDLLDQQIIDAHGRKVVRVTDVTFQIRPGQDSAVLVVVEVDVGLRSVLRRLLQGVAPRRWIRRLQNPVPPNSISWEYCNIIEPDPMRRLRLNITPAGLQKLHPADLAEIVEDLGPEGREAVLTALDSESAAETLSELDPDVKASILESLEAEQAAAIIEEMAPDEAVDALQELELETTAGILQEMETAEKSEITELLEYEEHTAGGLMTTEYLTLADDRTCGEALEQIRLNPEMAEGATAIFLLNPENRLTGTVPLSRLISAAEGTLLRDIAAPPLKIHVDQNEKKVAEMFDKYNLLCLGVVDDADRLAGIITADDVISLLRRPR